MDTGKRHYSVTEAYWFLYDMIRTAPSLYKARRHMLIDTKLEERIMLAVTQVNECPLCSYAHTKIALKSGITEAEIRLLLAGTMDTIPSDELEAIMFAQYYADQRGRMAGVAWQNLQKRYGNMKARGILGAVRMIMVGNVYGIAAGSFCKRWIGKPDKRSSLGYELVLLLSLIPFVLFASLHALMTSWRSPSL